jgi:hypothetical protein
MSDKEDVLKELKAFQADLYSKLKDIRVPVDPNRSPEVVEAIVAIYGDDFIKGPAYISFDMYIQCLEIIKQAGKDKGEQLAGGYII